MTTMKVRISFVPDTAWITSVPEAQAGDVYSGVFDITGDTTVEFPVPFTNDCVYRAVEEFDTITGHDDPSCIGRLVVQVVNPIATSPGTVGCDVDYAVYMAGGEDYQLSRPDGWAANWAVTPGLIPPLVRGVTKKCDVYALFNKPFKPALPIKLSKEKGLASPEHIVTIVELMRRFELNQVIALNSTVTLDNGFDGFSALTWHRRLAWPFALWRGGVHYKAIMQFISSNNQCNIQINSTYGDTPTLGELTISGMRRQATWGAHAGTPNEVYVPFSDLLHCREVTPSLSQLPDPDTVSFTTVNTAHELWMAVGDDFTLGPFIGIPLIQYTTPGASKDLHPAIRTEVSRPHESDELNTVSSSERAKVNFSF